MRSGVAAGFVVGTVVGAVVGVVVGYGDGGSAGALAETPLVNMAQFIPWICTVQELRAEDPRLQRLTAADDRVYGDTIYLNDGTHLHGDSEGAEDIKWQCLHLWVASCCTSTLSPTFGKDASNAAGTLSIRLSSRSGESAESVDSTMSSQSSRVGLMLGTTVGMLHWSKTLRRPTLTSEAGVDGRVHGGTILPRWLGSITTWSLVARSVQLC